MVILPPCIPEECGKGFRNALKKPSPIYTNTFQSRNAHKPGPRLVPAFTIQAMQDNTKVIPPPICGVFEPQPLKPTKFGKSYLRGEFPLSIEFTSYGKKLNWKIPVEKLDFHYYLPMFFEGLSEGTYPFSFIVECGIKDLVTKGSHKVLPVLPLLIVPIKNALATKRPNVMIYTLRCIQNLVTGCDRVGEALVPYYRRILPTLNLFKDRNRGLIDLDQTIVREENLGDVIEDTLQILERYGGPDAFINIKYVMPTYESCVLN